MSKRNIDSEKTSENNITLVDKKKCFIITPIGDDTSPIRRHIEGVIDAAIIPALGDKYEIRVSHRISEQGLITKQIIKEIYNDELVIANLTERNPNVMYELALCHAFGKPVIMIAEKNTPLPADVIMQRTIFYHNDAQGVLDLREELKKAESETKFGQKSGPIIDILGDINHDVTLLQQAKSENSNDIDQLEYIINRLNRIEDAVSSNRKIEKYIHVGQDNRRTLGFNYNYEKVPEGIPTDILSAILKRRINEQISEGTARFLRIDPDKKSLEILVDTNTYNDVSTFHDKIVSILDKSGFEGVA